MGVNELWDHLGMFDWNPQEVGLPTYSSPGKAVDTGFIWRITVFSRGYPTQCYVHYLPMRSQWTSLRAINDATSPGIEGYHIFWAIY